VWLAIETATPRGDTPGLERDRKERKKKRKRERGKKTITSFYTSCALKGNVQAVLNLHTFEGKEEGGGKKKRGGISAVCLPFFRAAEKVKEGERGRKGKERHMRTW